MSSRKRTPALAPLTVGYARVSATDLPAEVDAHTAVIRAEAKRRGWTVEVVVDHGVSVAVTPGARPALGPLLADLDARGGTLLVDRLDGLGRSLADLAALLDRAQAHGWAVVVLDVGLDMSTAAGRMTAGVLVSVAAVERGLIRARTREALAARKAAGVRLGRPRLVDPALAERIRAERTAGSTLAAVADRLNAENIRTPTGREWTPATVRKITLQVPADEDPRACPGGVARPTRSPGTTTMRSHS